MNRIAVWFFTAFILCQLSASECVSKEVIYVGVDAAGTASDGLLRFDTAGNQLSFTKTSPPGTLAIAPQGDVFALGATFNGIVRRYTAEGNSSGVFALVDSSFASGLAFDPMDRLNVGFANSPDPKQIERFDAAGISLGIFHTFGPGAGGWMGAMEFDADGILYLGDGPSIGRYDQDGTALGTFALLEPASLVREITFDSIGNLYIASTISIGRDSFTDIHTFGANGDFLNSFRMRFANVLDLAVDKSGTIYLAMDGPGIRRFLPDGTSLGTLVPEPDGMVFTAIAIADVVPEPTSWMLWLVATLFLGIYRRR